MRRGRAALNWFCAAVLGKLAWHPHGDGLGMVDELEHPNLTRRSRYRYCFASKHHGGGSSSDAQWSVDVSHAEEFSEFDTADFHDSADERGWLYGVRRADAGGLRDLGTWGQQVAEFPVARAGVPWHGYPLWAVNEEAPANRAAQKTRPGKDVFAKIELAGLITRRERKRLWKGSHT